MSDINISFDWSDLYIDSDDFEVIVVNLAKGMREEIERQAWAQVHRSDAYKSAQFISSQIKEMKAERENLKKQLRELRKEIREAQPTDG